MPGVVIMLSLLYLIDVPNKLNRDFKIETSDYEELPKVWSLQRPALTQCQDSKICSFTAPPHTSPPPASPPVLGHICHSCELWAEKTSVPQLAATFSSKNTVPPRVLESYLPGPGTGLLLN